MMPHTGSSDTMEAHRVQDRDDDSHLTSNVPARTRSIWPPRGAFYQWFDSIDKGLLQPSLSRRPSQSVAEENRQTMELGGNLRGFGLVDEPPQSSRSAIFE